MKERGFTLLEVLIALAILAIASAAVISQTSSSIHNLDRLELKNTALWIADNQLAYIQSLPDWPALGRRSESFDMAGQQWRIDTSIEATSEPWLRKVDVTVGLDGADINLISLTAFRGRY